MSTNASIAKVFPDGKVKEISVHWDGYIEGVGTTLQNYYQDPAKVDALIALGEISKLGQYVETAPSLKKYGTKAFDMAQQVVADDPEQIEELNAYTVAYHRDRGESLTPAYEFDSLDEYYQSLVGDIFTEYVYINIDNVWYVRYIIDDEGNKSKPEPLSKIV